MPGPLELAFIVPETEKPVMLGDLTRDLGKCSKGSYHRALGRWRNRLEEIRISRRRRTVTASMSS